MEDTVDTLSVRVRALEEERDRNLSEHGKIFGKIEAIEKGNGIMQADINHIRDLCDEIKADVKTLKERPVNRYERIVGAVMQWLVLGALAAAIAFK